jgi:hypothetical protein
MLKRTLPFLLVLIASAPAWATASYTMPTGFDITNVASAVLTDNTTYIFGAIGLVTGVAVLFGLVRAIRGRASGIARR